MGFRFRRSVKIAPGVRLNLNKKSTSVSFGGRGARHTISSTGKQTSTVGLPGTGMSYSTTHSNKGSSGASDSEYLNNSNAEIMDQFNEYIYNVTSLHKDENVSVDWNEIKNTPPPFDKGTKGPKQLEAEKVLEEYKPSFIDKLFSSRLENKTKKLKADIDNAILEDNESYDRWKEDKVLAEGILEENNQTYIDLLDYLNFKEAIHEIGKNVKLGFEENNHMIIEYDIQISSIVPEEYPNITNAGNLTMRSYNKTDYYELVSLFVSGASMKVARYMLELLPLDAVTVNTKKEHLNTSTGNIDHDTLLSCTYDRKTLNNINFERVNPFDALSNFDNEFRFLKTRGFQPVTPKIKIT